MSASNPAHAQRPFCTTRFSGMMRTYLAGGPMLTVGDTFPAFKLKACVSLERGHEYADVTERTHAGKWQVVFFWPMDFTAVCPTEVAAFARQELAFRERGAQLLGGST